MARLTERRWPLWGSVALVLSGLAYSFFWNPVVHSKVGWMQAGDIWATFRSAHYVGWGDLSDIYNHETGFLAFPGIAVLLAPVAMLTYHFGLSESFPWALPHPSAWPILGPISMVIGVLPLFAFDAIAEYLGATRRTRFYLCAGQVVLLWPVLVIWGHPEDAIALGLAGYGLLATWKKRWASAGWLFGGAVLFQPVVVLLLPITLALFPSARRRMGLVIRTVLPSAVLLAIPLIQSWGPTTYALVKQPTYPSIDHPTPLLFLAPVLGQFHPQSKVALVQVGTVRSFVSGTAKGGEIVAPGLGRLAVFAVAVLIGLWVWRHRPDPLQTLWLGAVALGAWCVFEPVMTPYYTWPVLAFVLVSAALSSDMRLLLTFGATLFVTIWSEHFFASPWVWWGPTVAMIALALYWSRPETVSRPQENQPEALRS